MLNLISNDHKLEIIVVVILVEDYSEGVFSNIITNDFYKLDRDDLSWVRTVSILNSIGYYQT